MEAVNSDADFLTRHAAQIASRSHHTAKILLTASPVWTLMTTTVDRAAVGHVVASTRGEKSLILSASATIRLPLREYSSSSLTDPERRFRLSVRNPWRGRRCVGSG